MKKNVNMNMNIILWNIIKRRYIFAFDLKDFQREMPKINKFPCYFDTILMEKKIRNIM